MNLARMVDCLDEQLCADILSQCEHSEFIKSLTLRNGAPSQEDVGRTNTQTTVPEELDSRVHAAANAALLTWSEQIKQEYPEVCNQLKLPGITAGLKTRREQFTLLRYQIAEEYKYHVDAPLYSSPAGNLDLKDRLISVVMYVNDDFTGGETEMFGRKYKPVQGKALIFPSNWNYPHRACPVTKGEKIAIVTWYHAYF